MKNPSSCLSASPLASTVTLHSSCLFSSAVAGLQGMLHKVLFFTEFALTKSSTLAIWTLTKDKWSLLQ